MKTLLALTTFLLGAIATILQQNALYWIDNGEMALARTNLNAMWWITGSCVVLGATLIFMLLAELRRIKK
jgi:energy-converting hydrogenase Eha subunit C